MGREWVAIVSFIVSVTITLLLFSPLYTYLNPQTFWQKIVFLIIGIPSFSVITLLLFLIIVNVIETYIII